MIKTAFMIMDFSDKVAEAAYRHHIRPICEGRGLTIRRADEVFTANPVYEDIIREIRDASVIVADISTRNPNVYYELGISHMMKQSQTIMITHRGYKALPFDIAHFRILKYGNTIKGGSEFAEQLTLTLATLLKNYAEVYREEFELIAEVLTSSRRGPDIMALIGLCKATSTVSAGQKLTIEGENPEKLASASATFSGDTFEPFVKMGFVSRVSRQFVSTEKGRAFGQYLESKGYVCHSFNGEVFTPGYESPFKGGLVNK